MKTELADGEWVQTEMPADLFRGWEGAGGRLPQVYVVTAFEEPPRAEPKRRRKKR